MSTGGQSFKSCDCVVEFGFGFMNDDALDGKLFGVQMIKSKPAKSSVAQNKSGFIVVLLCHCHARNRGANPKRYERVSTRLLSLGGTLCAGLTTRGPA